MSLELELADAAATEELGARLAQVVRAGDTIFLRGELGAGKTSLARGFLRRFFADATLDVPSPSYLISFTYSDAPVPAPPSAGGGGAAAAAGRSVRPVGSSRLPGVSVVHLDPYRLPEGKVAALIDLPSIFASQVSLVEWPERLGAQLVTETTPARLELRFAGIGPQARGRTVTMRAVGERWAPLVAEWAAAGRVAVELPPLPPPAAAAATSEAASDAADAGGGASAVAPATASAVAVGGDPREWLVLGIESSCDDTGAAVVRGDGTVIGEVLASQAGVHEAYGGVVPRLAQQAHREAIDATVDEALRRAGVSAAELTAIAVTVGPGLSMCLEVGVRKALQLSARHRLPLLRVHHMEAHAMVTWLPPPAAAPTAAAPTAAAAPPPPRPPPPRRRRRRS